LNRRSADRLGYLVFKIIRFDWVVPCFQIIIALLMKQLKLRFGFVCLSFTTCLSFSLAQVVPDTTHINIGDKTIIVIDASPTANPTTPSPSLSEVPVKPDKEVKSELTHFAGIDFGYCEIVDENGSMTRDSSTEWLSINNNKSLTWRLNLLEKKIRIYRDYVGVYSGFAIAYNSYGFARNSDVTVDKEGDGVSAVEVEDSNRNYRKNKLRTTILQVPLMFEFNTRNQIKQNFHLALGAIGGWVTSSITKQKWENDTGKFTLRRKEDFLVTPFTLDISARIGYKKSALFFTYGLTPLFEKNEGLAVYPITFGIQLTQF
jgi:hypothetical protein